MKEMMKNKPCFFILVVVAVGEAEIMIGLCHVIMALTLAILVVFLIKGKY